jgi:hypothetical protein
MKATVPYLSPKPYSYILPLTQPLNKLEQDDEASINTTNTAALLDGRCGGDEWYVATKINLPAQTSVYLMHDEHYFYLCATGKVEDFTALNLYIEHGKTGHLHQFHLSAQMGERVRTDKGWGPSATWDIKDYAGFWVPFFGTEKTENGRRLKFALGTHRQIQVSRKKFAGDIWNMMIGVSGINHKGSDEAEFLYPEKAVADDKSTWAKFSFSK